MLKDIMPKSGKLSLPDNWESVLELTMLQRPLGAKLARTYICSPCRADTPEGVINNMKAARVYMYYSYINFQGIPRAPHAYLPFMLNDNIEDERKLALCFGARLLMDCDLVLVCGNRLSEGMYDEIKVAAKRNIPIHVFNDEVHFELCACFIADNIDTEYALYEAGHPHYMLSIGAKELSSCWGDGQI